MCKVGKKLKFVPTDPRMKGTMPKQEQAEQCSPAPCLRGARLDSCVPSAEEEVVRTMDIQLLSLRQLPVEAVLVQYGHTLQASANSIDAC